MKSSIIERVKGGQFVLTAEIGVNYYDIARKEKLSALEAAMLMIDEAKKAGIHAVKFQTYKAEKLAARNSPSYWDLSEEPTASQYKLFKHFDSFGHNEYRTLSDYCRKAGIEFYSTPFDFESADYLEDLMEVYKISSSDLNNLPFIAHIAKKNKPIMLSTGASNADEIDTAVQLIRRLNNQVLILMHCVLEYPTPYEHANLNKILSLKGRYNEKYNDVIIGYSDHTKPDINFDVVKTAFNLGAMIIEKHFTLDKTLPGNDHYHAMDADDARAILKAVGYMIAIRGKGDLVCLESEAAARKNARRSIVSNGKIPAGEMVTEKNLVYKRPGFGISPSLVYAVIGKKARYDIEDDTILDMSMLE